MGRKIQDSRPILSHFAPFLFFCWFVDALMVPLLGENRGRRMLATSDILINSTGVL